MAPIPATKKTPVRKTVNAANLQALGAEALAALLLAIADDHPPVKRRLRLALAAEAGPQDLAAELYKHVDAVRAAKGKVSWRKLRALGQDLELTRATILIRLGPADPAAAVRLLLAFSGLEPGVLSRVRDAKGEIGQVFKSALEDLEQVAAAAPIVAPEALSEAVEAVFAALDDTRVGAMGPLTRAMIPMLAPAGVALLRGRIETEMAPRRRVNAGWREALQALFDAQGDAEAYAASYSASEAVLPPIGARIAQRYLRVGQIAAAERALAVSDPRADQASAPAANATSRGGPAPDAGLLSWEAVWIALLEAKGEGGAAQNARWAGFERDLSPEPLRDYLRRLADFDDVIAADRAMAHARTFADFTRALGFLIAWPALSEAAALVLARAAEIDGLALETLEPAVRALEGRHPLAATLLLRAMVGDVLRFAQAQHFPMALAWLDEAKALAAQIGDFQGHDDHAAFERSLRAYLGRLG